MDSGDLTPLATVGFTSPSELLFYGHKKLLFTSSNSNTGTHDIWSLKSDSFFTNAFVEVLLPQKGRHSVRAWTLAGRNVMLFDQNSNRIFYYSLDNLWILV